ncbi:efflux RND transporter periplasmic adaptor subunit [Phenylobacterium immobile]|uniref:efflux RND transporter periplasmic adaptor subunit n=1 Tax=Phenylobacterium immobile TaxID=21 RepID=UPI000A7DAE07|nr:efflux RND transporter periplasmic adaptor subunit [Phenylobacterium immobile]
MLKRHFFLVGAVAVLVLMIVVGALRLMGGTGSPGQGGGQAEQRRPGGGAGPGGEGPGGGRRGPGGGAIVSAAAVQSKVFTDTLDVIGVAKGRQSVTLSAATTQLVDRVRFRDGQSVPRGAVLVELRATEQNAAIVQARARLVQAERAYERYRKLGQQGWASQAMVDQFQANYLSARADVEAAQARENDRIIRAPFAGVVGLSDIAPGALVNPGAAIVTLDDVSAIRVDFQIPEGFINNLRQGQAITAFADAYPNQPIPGRIATIDTRIDERTRAVTARAEFPNGDRRLKPGMMIRVQVVRGQRNSLAIPESALQISGESTFAFVIVKQGERTLTDQRPVVTGLRQDNMVEIREGLDAGDRVVADGLNKIQPGQPVKVGPSRPAPPPPPGLRL